MSGGVRSGLFTVDELSQSIKKHRKRYSPNFNYDDFPIIDFLWKNTDYTYHECKLERNLNRENPYIHIENFKTHKNKYVKLESMLLQKYEENNFDYIFNTVCRNEKFVISKGYTDTRITICAPHGAGYLKEFVNEVPNSIDFIKNK